MSDFTVSYEIPLRMDQTRVASDPMMTRFLRAGSEDERQQALARLLDEQAYTRIDGILGARFRHSGLPLDQREDIRNEIIVRLVNRLYRLTLDAEVDPIASFPDYVAMVAFHTFDDFVRKTFPLRTKLKNRLRYVLTHERKLAAWVSQGALVCGLREWLGREAGPRAETSIHLLPSTNNIPALLVETFRRLAAPVVLDELVSLLAPLFHVPANETHERIDKEDVPLDTRHPAEELESRQYLATLWKEILDLPLRQRVALLLHARDDDGESVTQLLPLSGVATKHQIAESLAMPSTDVADLWHRLPLDDLNIANMLQINRQQVINLRRSARDRLERRMRAREQTGRRTK